jgi:hypothetical protein
VSRARIVEVVLADELFATTGSSPQLMLDSERPRLGAFERAPGERDGVLTGEGAILALQTLGLLTPAEAAEWTRRFAIAVEGWRPGPTAPGSQVERAEDHLEQVLGELKAAPDTPSRATQLDRFEGAFALCLQAGLVQPAAARHWGERLEQALGKDLEDFELEQEGIDPDDDDYDLDEPLRNELGASLRLVPALPARHDGVCVTAVELNENGFRIHWHALLEGPADDLEPDDIGPVRVVDDIGTEYERIIPNGCTWTGHSGICAVKGESRCMTPVPDDATELRLLDGDAGWTVRLS